MFLAQTFNVCYDSLLSLIYPHACAVCGGSVESRNLGVACEKCWQSTELFSDSQVLCWKCGLPSLGLITPDKPEQVSCRRCDVEAFTSARACGAYEGALQASVLALKHEPHVCQRLFENLLETVRAFPLNQATVIMPVPLHAEREKARGFNQATIISRELSRALSLPLSDANLVRTKHVRVQRAGMDAKGRRDTVADAFQVVCPALIEGERVLLVDDVFTTGATVSACAEVLKGAGAADVFVFTIARAV